MWYGGLWSWQTIILHYVDDGGFDLDDIVDINICSVIVLAKNDNAEIAEKELLKWAKKEKWRRLVVADNEIIELMKKQYGKPIQTVLIRQERNWLGEWEPDIGVKMAFRGLYYN